MAPGLTTRSKKLVETILTSGNFGTCDVVTFRLALLAMVDVLAGKPRPSPFALTNEE